MLDAKSLGKAGAEISQAPNCEADVLPNSGTVDAKWFFLFLRSVVLAWTFSAQDPS